MTITTIAVGGTTLAFADTFVWTDELSWAPVEQRVERSITGALLVSMAARTVGRPVTLESIDGGQGGWLERQQLDQLYAWASVPGQVMVLTHLGVTRNVIWRHQDTAIEARPVLLYSDVQATDPFTAVLRLMAV